MTCRSLICFSAILLAFARISLAVVVSGSVILRDSQVPSVNKGQDNSGVVVYFIPLGGTGPIPLTTRHATMLQKNKTFFPHVLAVQAGTYIEFPNDDPIFHNAFSNYSGQVFDVGLYPPGTKRTVRFTRPGSVRVFCNIHAAMSAVIVVLETPYFSTTGKDGGWQVDLPPGRYEMHVVHERARPETLKALTKEITVPPTSGSNGSGTLSLGTITVSEAGYLPAAHLNKFGKSYPPGSGDDRSYYPGARK